MSVSGVGAIGGISSGSNVYALLSPYLNGVVRTSAAATAARIDATAQTTNSAVAQAAIAAEGNATATATALPPFANPAITSIGQRIALGQALGTTIAVTPDAQIGSTLDSLGVLTGDSGLLVQSYGAVALLAGVQANASVFAQAAATPLVTPPAIVAAIPRVNAIA